MNTNFGLSNVTFTVINPGQHKEGVLRRYYDNQRTAFCTDVATAVLRQRPHWLICTHFPASA
jgi:hypothetical protein